MDNDLIYVENLKRYFGPVRAVEGLNLKVPEGSITGILGPNGAGKTTTLHILTGILRRDLGKVSVFGYDPEKDPVATKSRTGFVMENPCGEPRFTIRQQLDFHKAFRPSWDNNFEKELLNLFRLREDKPNYSLSRGEQAKLALICALAFRPDLLILDDPTSGLDPLARREFIDGILRVLSDEGCTVLFSTHQVDDIERVADRIIMVDEGRDILSDSLENIRQNWRCFRLFFNRDKAPDSVNIPGIFRWEPANNEGIAIINKFSEETLTALKKLDEHTVQADYSLEDIYLEIVKNLYSGEGK